MPKYMINISQCTITLIPTLTPRFALPEGDGLNPPLPRGEGLRVREFFVLVYGNVIKRHHEYQL
jgi:hypothetical protein